MGYGRVFRKGLVVAEARVHIDVPTTFRYRSVDGQDYSCGGGGVLSGFETAVRVGV